MSSNSNIIALTMGDPSGVGTEIAIRAKIKKIKKPDFFIIHDIDFVKKILKKMKSKLKVREISSPSEVKKLPKNYLAVLPIKISKNTQLGKKNLSNIKSILASIDLAVKLAKNGEVAAIVTNPINKDVIGKKVKNLPRKFQSGLPFWAQRKFLGPKQKNRRHTCTHICDTNYRYS